MDSLYKVEPSPFQHHSSLGIRNVKKREQHIDNDEVFVH